MPKKDNNIGTPIEVEIDALHIDGEEEKKRNSRKRFSKGKERIEGHFDEEESQERRNVPVMKNNDLWENSEQIEAEEEEQRKKDKQNTGVVYSGYLGKKTDIGGHWKKRWMVLYTEGPLYYYDDIKDTEPSGVIHLMNAKLLFNIEVNGILDPFSLNIRVDKKDFLLKARTVEQKDIWCQVIEKNITKVVITTKSKHAPQSGSFYGKKPQEILHQQQGMKVKEVVVDDSDSDEDYASDDYASEDDEEIKNDEIAYEGVLYHYNGSRWGERWAILEKDGNLYLYEKQSDDPCLFVRLTRAELFSRVEQNGKELENCFNIHSGNKNNVFRASSPETKEEWVQTLKKNIPGANAVIQTEDERRKYVEQFEIDDSVTRTK